MALILLLETATAVCAAGLAREDQLLTSRETEGLVHGEKLAVFIQEILEETGTPPADLSAIALSIGPGSYTGLRVGLSTAKGLAFGLGLPIIALSTLEVLATAARALAPDAWHMAAIDARRQEVYALLMDPSGQVSRPAQPLILDEEGSRNGWPAAGDLPPLMASGDGAAKVEALWPDVRDTGVRCSVRHLVQPAFAAWTRGQFADLTLLEPEYLKPANITQPGPPRFG